MDAKRKKELLFAYKNRKPEMGVIAFRCTVTHDIFFHPSKDTKADINSSSFQLEFGNHPNRNLQALWNEHGAVNFEIAVAEVLPYDEKETDKDYTEDLEKLCALHSGRTEKAWRLKP